MEQENDKHIKQIGEKRRAVWGREGGNRRRKRKEGRRRNEKETRRESKKNNGIWIEKGLKGSGNGNGNRKRDRHDESETKERDKIKRKQDKRVKLRIKEKWIKSEWGITENTNGSEKMKLERDNKRIEEKGKKDSNNEEKRSVDKGGMRNDRICKWEWKEGITKRDDEGKRRKEKNKKQER